LIDTWQVMGALASTAFTVGNDSALSSVGGSRRWGRMSGLPVPVVDGRIKKVVLSAPRRSISSLEILREIRNEIRIPPKSLKDAFHHARGSEKKRLAIWAVYFCYQYADTTISELATLFKTDADQIDKVLEGRPELKSSDLLEFESLDQAISQSLQSKELIMAYDLQNRKVLSLDAIYQAQQEFIDPEHRLYEWFLPNTYAGGRI